MNSNLAEILRRREEAEGHILRIREREAFEPEWYKSFAATVISHIIPALERNAVNAESRLNGTAINRRYESPVLFAKLKLLATEEDFTAFQQRFFQAVDEADLVTMNALLQFPPEAEIDPGANFNQALRSACDVDHIEIARQLLTVVDPSIGLPANDTESPLTIACARNNEELVRLLLSDPRVRMSYEALQEVCYKGSLQLVKDVCEKIARNETFFTGIYHYEMRNIILSSARHRHAIFPLLLQLVQPSVIESILCTFARDGAHPTPIRMLLANPRTPFDLNNPLSIASRNGNFEVVQLLLTDCRLTTAGLKVAIADAQKAGHYNIVALLKSHKRSDCAIMGGRRSKTRQCSSKTRKSRGVSCGVSRGKKLTRRRMDQTGHRDEHSKTY